MGLKKATCMFKGLINMDWCLAIITQGCGIFIMTVDRAKLLQRWLIKITVSVVIIGLSYLGFTIHDKWSPHNDGFI